MTPTSPRPATRSTWGSRNRVALLALAPLLLLAAGAASFRYFTLYQPNEYSRVQRATGQTVTFRERFRSVGFGAQGTYERQVTITLESLRTVPAFEGQEAASGAKLWLAELTFQAAPDVPLEGCQIFLVDTGGTVYDDRAGKLGMPPTFRLLPCVPPDAPGPTIDFTGELRAAEGPPRPARWTVRRAVALPDGRAPAQLRVAWVTPNYAQIPVPTGR